MWSCSNHLKERIWKIVDCLVRFLDWLESHFLSGNLTGDCHNWEENTQWVGEPACSLHWHRNEKTPSPSIIWVSGSIFQSDIMDDYFSGENMLDCGGWCAQVWPQTTSCPPPTLQRDSHAEQNLGLRRKKSPVVDLGKFAGKRSLAWPWSSNLEPVL